MQVGGLVELVIRGLDIAAVVAADLQEPAYVVVEIGQNSVAVLGIAGEIAVGIVSPIELRSTIVRPRCFPVKGIVVVTDCELVSVLLLLEQAVIRLVGVRDQSLSMPNSIIAKEYCSNYKHAALTLKKRY